MDRGFHDGVSGVAERPPSAAIAAERSQAPAEVALSAYCRELCGPACDRAVAAIISVLEDGPDMISEADLLRATRATAAGFAFAGMDGSRGKVTATLSRECATTPRLLAASASSLLDPREERELAAHLQDCLPCNAIRIKQDRAERGFAVLWSSPAASPPRLATAPPAAAVAAAAPPAGLAEPRKKVATGAARLDGAHARAAVKAYCRELCGPRGLERAVATSLEPVEGAKRSRPVAEDELLRVTRSAAAEQAACVGAADGFSGACADMTIALAELANGDLRAGERRPLEDHLEQCLVCHATQIKMARAQRAFATMAAASGLESWSDLRAQPMRRHAPPQVSPLRAAAESATPAAGIAAAAPFPPTRAAPPPPPSGAVGTADRQRRVRKRRLIAVAAMLVTALAVAAAVVLSAAPSTSPDVHALANQSAHVSSARAATHAATVSRAAKAKATAAAHKVAAKVHHAAKAKPAHRAVTAHHPTAVKHTTPAAVVSAPARVAAPVTPARVVSAPKPASTKPATPAKPSTPTVTPQGTNLPAQTAPTKSIGSGG